MTDTRTKKKKRKEKKELFRRKNSESEAGPPKISLTEPREIQWFDEIPAIVWDVVLNVVIDHGLAFGPVRRLLSLGCLLPDLTKLVALVLNLLLTTAQLKLFGPDLLGRLNVLKVEKKEKNERTKVRIASWRKRKKKEEEEEEEVYQETCLLEESFIDRNPSEKGQGVVFPQKKKKKKEKLKSIKITSNKI